ncbi:MAG: hypothetical protein JXB29_06255 [Sedimentisphaerales bacterium]|nr:hypothetical protein [Sedimentisphaerales bacterium]
MDIKDILTKDEYTKEQSVNGLFEFFKQKNRELSQWSPKCSDAKTRGDIRYRVLDKGLPYKFAHELTPFAHYANTYYSNKPKVKFKPCCGSEQHDGIIIDNNKKNFVEITDAKEGWKWGLQKELLIKNGHAPWEHNVHGVEGNKTKQNRTANDIITSNELIRHKALICNAKKLVKEKTTDKCKKSLGPKLPYKEGKTILIVTFDDTGFSENDRGDFVNFKKAEIDSTKHKFMKIVLFGWVSKKFINT